MAEVMRWIAAISAGPRSASPRGRRAFTLVFGGWSVMALAGLGAGGKGGGPPHKRRGGGGERGGGPSAGLRRGQGGAARVAALRERKAGASFLRDKRHGNPGTRSCACALC